MIALQPDIQTFLFVAGISQVILVIGSLAIPKVLNWESELKNVQTLIRQMFWTYAAYILVINLCFGLLSVFAFTELTDKSLLAKVVTGFIAVYWISRVLIQFLYFDRKSFPSGILNRIAEVLLVTLFVALSAVYSWSFYVNFI
ncbi:hypothetical protein [Dyadobacter psychrotolerans]|uniref:Uncharacterized protein n=1 Tax=Dyadobacter psychrotolerans TaxID=2541721 RepID=A0A4R5DG64_9BACT|nr:hypothetical protein [Dyadobacter psychrotolerans]TDE12789.1 hypothetical protein E0F88_20800 [Dyadobacter psychrotolerans]